MGRGAIFTEHERALAAAHRKNNKSIRYIAAALRRSRGAVRNALRPRKKKPALGRPPVFNGRTRAAYVGHVKRSIKKADGR